MPDDLDKRGLLAEIRRERARLDDLIAQLDDDTMLTPARDDGWTAKDVLAHLTAWEQRLPGWIKRWRETGDPGRPEVGVTWEDFDTLNEHDHLAAKDNSVVDVRGEAVESYKVALLTLAALSDHDLAVRPDAADGPSWSWIIGANTHEHYQEHREEMEAWWEKNNT